MEFSNIVLLYSKYSPNSKKMIDILKNSDVDLRALSIQKICIDNENIRKRIIYSDSIEIKSVPAILVLYPDGGVEKFDGAHSFQFIQNVIQNYIQINKPATPPPTPPPPPPPPPQPQSQPQQNNKTKQTKSNKTSIDELFDIEDQDNNETENQPDNDTEDNVEIIEESSRNVKSSNNTNILAKAQELAKAREKEDAAKPRRPL